MLIFKFSVSVIRRFHDSFQPFPTGSSAETGLIDNSVVPLYTENMAEELANLKAPMGIYMVLGNHEYISGIDESIRYIKSTQIQLLRDSVVTLPNGIQLIGRDDRHNRKRHSPLAITVALLEDIIGHPINRPYLSVVCMPTELQVDAGSFRFFQIKRLMIQ